jgi:hypothetical protein
MPSRHRLVTRTATLVLITALAAAAAPAAAPATGPDAGAGADAPSEAQLTEARDLVQRFMKELKGELMAAMRDGGPSGAIGVCSEEAPRIASELTTASGWSLARTSLRVRNPRNAPDPAERAVLVEFDRRRAAGEDPATLEHARIVREGGLAYVHYMKAIPTSSLCLACHGSDVEASVREAIAATYPADAATGFARGDLRGAFTLVRPLD